VRALAITPPKAPLRGRVAPPGSKSITNRALMLAALSAGASHLTGALKSEDTARMAEALVAMGVKVSEPDETSFVVVGDGRLRAPVAPLGLGNAGTATRFLTAAAALADGPVVIDGDAHMRKRPIAPLVTALKMLGVEIAAPTGCPPVTVMGQGGVEGGQVEIDAGLSSQYVSALLMLAARARGPVEVALKGAGKDGGIGARGYVDLTLAAMRAFGARVNPSGAGAWRVEPTGYRAADLHIEPDASAATYLWAAERLTVGAIDLGLAPSAFTQPDAKAYDLIASFPHMPAVIEGSQMQDAVPTLAVLAAFNATELSRIRPGLAREEGDDLIVEGDPTLAGQSLPTRIQTYADHRIAMSFALAGLKIGGLVIVDPDCTAKTWPGYWDALKALGVELAYCA
jgi:3-phosphoshikimate 1-carboxyvinyltransferase